PSRRAAREERPLPEPTSKKRKPARFCRTSMSRSPFSDSLMRKSVRPRRKFRQFSPKAKRPSATTSPLPDFAVALVPVESKAKQPSLLSTMKIRSKANDATLASQRIVATTLTAHHSCSRLRPCPASPRELPGGEAGPWRGAHERCGHSGRVV